MEPGEVTWLTLRNHPHQANKSSKVYPSYKSSVLGTDKRHKGGQNTTLA